MKFSEYDKYEVLSCISSSMNSEQANILNFSNISFLEIDFRLKILQNMSSHRK